MAKRRNDGPWRRDCIDRRGHVCRACGTTTGLQCDHIIPRSQGGQSVIENGLLLGGPFSCQCHDEKTAHRLKIRRSWLDPDQIGYLAEQGWVWWDDEGEVWGRGRDDFEPEPPRAATVLRSLEPPREGATHGR